MPLSTAPNSYGIELAENEKIEHITKRHWMLLVYHLTIPVSLMVLLGLIAWYRWIGGQFFVFNRAPRGIFDSVNITLWIVIILSAIGIFFSFWRKNRNVMLMLGGVIVLSLAIFAFRYIGGRVFVINPFEAEGVDFVNRLFIGIIIALFLASTYLWADWRNDSVILTNLRVIHDKRDLFQRHVQDQIVIEKIESAKASKKTYLTHWLDYGTLVIQATTVGRRMLLEMADEPKIMADKISDKLKAHKNKRSDEHFSRMISEHVYGEKQIKSYPPLKLRVRQSPKLLNWLFFDNPEVDDNKGEVIWYTHWIFVFLSVALPFFLFVVGLVLLLISIRISFIIGLWSVVVGSLLVVVCGIWGVWRYKDTTDDELKLTPTNIIKLDKLPFGPERRRTANLGAIKNVSYRSSFIGRLIGYGTIDVQTAGPDTNMSMEHIPDPREVVATIYEYMLEFRTSERERTLNDTLMLFQHFHHSQKDHGEFFDDEGPMPSHSATS